MKNTIARAITATAVVAGFAGAAFAGTAIGHATTMDDAFVQVLHEEGIGHNGGDAQLIAAGYEACNNLRAGRTIQQEFAAIHRVSSLDWGQSGYFVGASVAAYCPEFTSAVLAAAY
jgi:Protein of unknown function (DUF732)